MLEGLEGMSIRDVSWCPEIVLLCFEGRFRNVIVCMISSRIFLFLEALLVAVGVRPAIFLGGSLVLQGWQCSLSLVGVPSGRFEDFGCCD